MTSNLLVLVLSEAVLVLVIEKRGAVMADQMFDHEKLDVYRLAIEYVGETFRIAENLSGLHRHSRDQWLRAALECSAIQDVLLVSKAITPETSQPMKARIKRIVAMLTRLAMRSNQLAESSEGHDVGIDYEHEHEHRCAEHESQL